MQSAGKKIKKFRELRNFTQGYVAERLGISQSNYARIENEDISLSEERLLKIAEILDTDKESILGFDDKYVFNFNNNQHSTNNGIVHQYQISPEIKKLYEDKIKLLEDRVKELEERLISK
ncbi:helix-turn-helix domain-containing protein [Pedobacter glucosidilyticus]|uniref:helix-turn-helix domain-containing protein n=1 Tax=Pedobacter glucosidilyticus TaxID=1122941 RepID=UPI0003FE97DF|nr:helix-turn-helix transcriptional regulator [Pedobacter glucosidilyticus]